MKEPVICLTRLKYIVRLDIAEVSTLPTVLQYQTVRHPVHRNRPELGSAAQAEQCESK